MDPTATWTGQGGQPSAEYGSAVAGGDWNGDGYSDLLVGAWQYAAGEATEGRVQLYLGSSTGPVATSVFEAEANSSGARLGGAVAFVDVDGDGSADAFATSTASRARPGA